MPETEVVIKYISEEYLKKRKISVIEVGLSENFKGHFYRILKIGVLHSANSGPDTQVVI